MRRDDHYCLTVEAREVAHLTVLGLGIYICLPEGKGGRERGRERKREREEGREGGRERHTLELPLHTAH